MPEQPLAQIIPAVDICTTPHSDRQLPSWFAQTLLLMRAAYRYELHHLFQSIHVDRGRMGDFEAIDFAIALLAYAASDEPTIEHFYEAIFDERPRAGQRFRALMPDAMVLPAIFGRHAMPSRFALSRFLAHLTPTHVESLRDAFRQDLLQHGLNNDLCGGIFDRTGRRHLLFDIDDTKETARQRPLTTDNRWPAPIRRLENLVGPARTGRKRADAARNRLVVQQTHTQQWMGSFGRKGSGRLAPDLDRATDEVLAYLRAQKMAADDGTCRLDGLYGHAVHLAPLRDKALQWLCRCVDYRLLEHPTLLSVLDQQSPQHFEQRDTLMSREVFDIGFIDWKAADERLVVNCRIVLTRRRPTKKERTKPRVGVLKDGHILELFATTHPYAAFSATDIVQLYLCRGGFESTLFYEDNEVGKSRFASGHLPGQEFFEILCQWVCNLRLRVAVAADGQAARVMQFAEAHPAQSMVECEGPRSAAQDACAVAGAEQEVSVRTMQLAPPVVSTPHAPVEVLKSVPVSCEVVRAPGQVAPAAGRGSGRFGGSDFVWQSDGTLVCPGGATLHRCGSQIGQGGRRRETYAAAARHCRSCPLSAQCLGGGTRIGRTGRRVTVYRTPTSEAKPSAPEHVAEQVPLTQSSPSMVQEFPSVSAPLLANTASTQQEVGPYPVLYHDISGSHLRLALQRTLRQQRVAVVRVGVEGMDSTPTVQTRHQRAHGRLSWEQRLQRNAVRASERWSVRISGVPPGVSSLLQLVDPAPS